MAKKSIKKHIKEGAIVRIAGDFFLVTGLDVKHFVTTRLLDAGFPFAKQGTHKYTADMEVFHFVDSNITTYTEKPIWVNTNN